MFEREKMRAAGDTARTLLLGTALGALYRLLAFWGETGALRVGAARRARRHPPAVARSAAN